MAVLQMQRISICALKEQRKEILEILQRKGIVEICDVMAEDGVFSKTDVSKTEAMFEKSSVEAENALEILNTYSEEKKSMLSSFAGRTEIETEIYENFKDKYKDVRAVILRLQELGKKVAEDKAEILQVRQQIETLQDWKSFDMPLSFKGTKHTKAFIGILPGTWDLEKVYESLAGLMPLDIDIISATREQTCIILITHNDLEEKVYDKLKSIGFSYPPIVCDHSPVEQIRYWENDIENLNNEVNSSINEIISLESSREDVKFFADYQRIRADKYNVIGRVLQSEHVFVLTGFIPALAVDSVKAELEKFDAEIDLQEVSDQDDAPVALKNNSFSSPLEGIVESFSLPGKGEIDPTFLVSIFYYLFFGLMLSDFMYGLILFAGTTFLMLKFKSMEKSMKSNLKIFMYCGISTMFWGVMFSSYFGDFVKVVSTTFFGTTVTIKPLWIDMTANPMTILTLSLILGIIHIFTGLAAKLYQCLKNKDIQAVLFDVLAWYAIVIGLLMKLVSMQMIMDILGGGADPLLSLGAGNVGGYIAIVAAIVIILTGGRDSKNIGKRLAKGAYALYGITGYLSDVLSYSRLLALGLATGVICSVANMIGTMFGGGVVGAIIFAFVFLAINALNISINSLGAYVHTNRLQYVEFFSRFYDGGGRKFEPYSINTKYFKFKEKK